MEIDRTGKADIGGHEATTELDDQDLEKMKDMPGNMGLCDKPPGELEELKHVCVDRGVTCAEFPIHVASLRHL